MIIATLLLLSSLAQAQEPCPDSGRTLTPVVPNITSELGRNCLIPSSGNELTQTSACECVNNLKVSPELNQIFSEEIRDQILAPFQTPAKIALLHLSNEISGLSQSVSNSQGSSFLNSCNLERLKSTTCGDIADPLFQREQITELISTFQNTLENNYRTQQFLSPDLVDERTPENCQIPNAAILRVGHQVNLARVASIIDLANIFQEFDPNNEANTLADLFSVIGPVITDNQSSAINDLFSSASESPIIFAFMNNEDVLNNLRSNDIETKFNPETALNLLIGDQVQQAAVEHVESKCRSLSNEISEIFCTDQRSINPSFSRLRRAVSSTETTYNNDNADLKLHCNRNSVESAIPSNLDDHLPRNLRSTRAPNFERAFFEDYGQRITRNKISRDSIEGETGGSEVRSLSMCDYIPQPGRENFQPFNVEQAITQNCGENNENSFTMMCLQARAVKTIYGERLSTISELEQSITAAVESGNTNQTIEFEGVQMTIAQARARREVLTVNLFSQDMQKPAIVEEFVSGRRSERPTRVATTSASPGNETPSSAPGSNQTGSDSTTTLAASSGNSGGSSSRAVEYNPTSSTQANPFEQNNNSQQDYVSQAQRDQNTRDLFNEVQRRIQTGNQRSKQELNEIGNEVRNLRSEVNSGGRSSSLTPFQSDMLSQSTSHLPVGRYSGTINSDDNQYALSAPQPDENGAFIFPARADANNIGGSDGDETIEESRNRALEEKYANRRTPASSGSRNSGGRSPASSGGAASAGGAPLTISNGGTSSDGVAGPPTINIPENQNNSINIIDLAAGNSTSAEEMIRLIGASEVEEFIIQKGRFRIKVKKEGNRLVVDSLDRVQNREFQQFLTSIRNTMNNRSVMDVIRSIELTMCQNPENSDSDRCSAATRYSDLSSGTNNS